MPRRRYSAFETAARSAVRCLRRHGAVDRVDPRAVCAVSFSRGYRHLRSLERAAAARWPDLESRDAELAAATPGCYLEVSEQQRIDLEPWLRARRLAAAPLI